MIPWQAGCFVIGRQRGEARFQPGQGGRSVRRPGPGRQFPGADGSVRDFRAERVAGLTVFFDLVQPGAQLFLDGIARSSNCKICFRWSVSRPRFLVGSCILLEFHELRLARGPGRSPCQLVGTGLLNVGREFFTLFKFS